MADDYFLEPSFQVAVVHLTAGHMFYVDSGGQVALPLSISGPTVPAQSLRRLLHQGPENRLTRVTLKSANIGPGALRSRGLGAYAIDGLAPGFDDHLFVCRTAEGCVGPPGGTPTDLKRRYVGFANARVREAGSLLDLHELVEWFEDLDDGLTTPAGSPWTSNDVQGSVTHRNLVGASTGNDVWTRIRSLLRSPHAQKEVWLVLGNVLSRGQFEDQLRARKPAHEAVQAAYLLEGLISAAISLSIRVRIFCMP